MDKPKLPKYSLVDSYSNSIHAVCDECGRELKHFHVVKNNETNQELVLGSGCVLKYCDLTISQIKKENDEYIKIVNAIDVAEKYERERTANVSSFEEVDAEVWEYILANASDNMFLNDMKHKVEQQGSIPENALKAIKVMMIPFKEIDKGTLIEGTFEVLHFKADVTEERYSTQANVLITVTDGKEKFRVKTTYSKSNYDFVTDTISLLRHEDPKHRSSSGAGCTYSEMKFYPEPKEYFIDVKGKFDGWKVSRAKISFSN